MPGSSCHSFLHLTIHLLALTNPRSPISSYLTVTSSLITIVNVRKEIWVEWTGSLRGLYRSSVVIERNDKQLEWLQNVLTQELCLHRWYRLTKFSIIVQFHIHCWKNVNKYICMYKFIIGFLHVMLSRVSTVYRENTGFSNIRKGSADIRSCGWIL